MTTDSKTFILLAGMMALFLGLGQLFGGTQGMPTALLIGGALNFVMYFFSDKMVLKMYRARVVTAKEAPQLYEMVDRLRQRAGLPRRDRHQRRRHSRGDAPLQPVESRRWWDILPQQQRRLDVADVEQRDD